MKLLEIEGFRAFNLMEPDVDDVCAVYKGVDLSDQWIKATREWISNNICPGNGLYDPKARKYLNFNALIAGKIEWTDAVKKKG